jgi:G3E family GTPase
MMTGMQLVVISGFLGSGKTTAMLSFARDFASSGVKTALIVNEIGEIGIDNVVLEQAGSDVWELLGGCICCTLAGQLGTTLARLAADYRPEIVFLEPSGASHPDAITAALGHTRDVAVERVSWLTVIDPLRLEELVAVLEPLMESQIRAADAVIITKRDAASSQQLTAAKEWIAGMRAGLPCFSADMKNDASRPSLEEIFPCLSRP